MNNNNQNTPTAVSCKVVLLGESGVGKTSVISRFINNTFQANNMSTTGASFAAKTMYFEKYDKTVKFEIWDTAGQEKYRTLTKIFYKDAAVAILVYDITRKVSFDEIKNYWYAQLKEHAPKKLIIAFAANKADLYETEQVNEESGRGYAKEIGSIFKLTSAKNASGIEDLFKSVGLKFIDPDYSEDKTEEDIEKEKIRRQTIRITPITKKDEDKAKKGCC